MPLIVDLSQALSSAQVLRFHPRLLRFTRAGKSIHFVESESRESAYFSESEA